MKNHNLLIFSAFLFFDVEAQTEIRLSNPSFEDAPKNGKTPSGWATCGWRESETPPDIQPGSFGVEKEAQEGSTYLGMVVRDNETREALGQRLSAPLLRHGSYSFSLWLARSEQYLSNSRVSEEPANFGTPAKLLIWGGNNYCDKAELLGESEIVSGFEWLLYEFVFNPEDSDYTHILLEAYYKTPVLFAYNGNILVDNCSALAEIPNDRK